MARTRRNTRRSNVGAKKEPEAAAEEVAPADNGFEETADDTMEETPAEGGDLGEEAQEVEPENEDTEAKVEGDSQETVDDETTNDYSRLVAADCPEKIAELVQEIIFNANIMTFDDLSADVISILSQDFSFEKLESALKEFVESDFSTIKGDKSAHLLSLLKSWNDDGDESKSTGDDSMRQAKGMVAKRHGPDEAKIKELLERTGYKHEVTNKGRVYGPPPDVEEKPEHKQEIFVGKLARDVYEDELVPLFEKFGKIFDIKILTDPASGFNRGFAFVNYCEKPCLYEAAKALNDHEIRPGKLMKVNVSIPNQRLFVGNVPKQKSKEEIVEEFKQVSEGLTDVIVYSNPDDEKKLNRGFAFLEYSSHTAAANARQKFLRGVRAFGNSICSGDWADPEEEPDEETMKKVKILHVRNLSSDVSEEQLKKHFSEPLGENGASKIAKVKKVKYNAFIEFNEREDAVTVMEAVNGTDLGKQKIEVALAKPAADKERRDQRRSRGGGMRGGGRGRGLGAPRGGPRGGPPRGRGGWGGNYGHQGMGSSWGSGSSFGHQGGNWGGGYGGPGGWGASSGPWGGPPPMRGPGGMGMSRGSGHWGSGPSGPPQRMGGWGGPGGMSGGGWGGNSGNYGGRGSWGGPGGGMRGGFGGGMRGGFGGRGGMRGGRGGRGGQKRSRGGGRSNGDGNVAKKPRLDSGSGSASGPGAAGDGGTAGVSNEGPAADWGNQPIAQQPLSKAEA